MFCDECYRVDAPTLGNDQRSDNGQEQAQPHRLFLFHRSNILYYFHVLEHILGSVRRKLVFGCRLHAPVRAKILQIHSNSCHRSKLSQFKVYRSCFTVFYGCYSLSTRLTFFNCNCVGSRE